MIVGWVGLGLLMFSYVVLISKFKKWFVLLDTIASILLTTHAIILGDIPFIIVNGWIAMFLFYKLYKKDYGVE